MHRRTFLAAMGLGAAAGVTGAGSALGALTSGEDLRSPPRAFPSLFGYRSYLAGDTLEKLPRARVCIQPLEPEVLRGFARQLYSLIPAAGAGGTHWRTIVEKTASLDPMIRMRLVNDFVNAVPYAEDRENYGMPDYWAETATFFAMGGDCEDYAIAKYKLLQQLGFHPDRLRIVLLIDQARRRQHAVLAVVDGGEGWILDSAQPQILPHRSVRDYRPTVSVGGRRLFVHLPPEHAPSS